MLKKSTTNGQWHFSLLSSNGRVVASSEMYKTKAAALNGIESVRKNAASAALVEETG